MTGPRARSSSSVATISEMKPSPFSNPLNNRVPHSEQKHRKPFPAEYLCTASSPEINRNDERGSQPTVTNAAPCARRQNWQWQLTSGGSSPSSSYRTCPHKHLPDCTIGERNTEAEAIRIRPGMTIRSSVAENLYSESEPQRSGRLARPDPVHEGQSWLPLGPYVAATDPVRLAL